MSSSRDLLIIGLGPAAYTCAIYCARYRMNVALIGAQPGGQMGASGEVENYPGFLSIPGQELAQKMMDQTKENGADVVFDTVDEITKMPEGDFLVKGTITGEYRAKSILLSTGTKRRKLGVLGEEEYYGKGLTYCATCDGMFYRNLPVAVVGAGNSAAEAALYLADICESVRVFVRKDHFRADAVLVEKINNNPKIIVEFLTEIAEVQGGAKMERVLLKNGETRDIRGLFIEIGANPENTLAKQLGVDLDSEGYLVVDSGQRTNISGVFAAGDNTTASEKFAQNATAVGEGAVAAKAAHEFYQHSDI
ncbi:FAD-dependent oxidoreductase [Candidatus Peregrinibacteria bacterium]|nr:MAG: FAD-dependent oxidoreductase [Candidatus Peregrinibacteria bacterium]